MRPIHIRYLNCSPRDNAMAHATPHLPWEAAHGGAQWVDLHSSSAQSREALPASPPALGGQMSRRCAAGVLPSWLVPCSLDRPLSEASAQTSHTHSAHQAQAAQRAQRGSADTRLERRLLLLLASMD